MNEAIINITGHNSEYTKETYQDNKENGQWISDATKTITDNILELYRKDNSTSENLEEELG